MKQRVTSELRKNDSGAVAATYALSLTALVAIAGVAFDYARLAGMDSELQNGADQAALAGATQLDKEDGACARATNAAIALLNNETLLANDIGERSVQINSGNVIAVADDTCTGTTGVIFWQDKAKTTPATTDETAGFIEVRVDARIAEYAFTPVVGALNSGNVDAAAMAGLGSSICKVPPLMICSPTPGAPFLAENRVGWGVKATGHGGASWAPGSFGFLEVGSGQTADLVRALAYGDANLDCSPIDGTTVEPGNAQDLFRAINTRFDIYDFSSGAGTTLGPCLGGLCPPAPNTTKDLVNTNTNFNGNNACKIGNSGWKLPTNRFSPAARDVGTETVDTLHDADGLLDAIGLTRDLCHYNSYNTACNSLTGLTGLDEDPESKFGPGNWARGDYFGLNHGTTPSALGAQNWTRYQTYLWEQGLFGTGGSPANPSPANGQRPAPVCQPASTGDIDRRLLTVAIVSNCEDINPSGSVIIEIDEWVEMFLVEPIVDDTTERANGRDQDVVYMEVVGPSTVGDDGGGGVQNVRRDVPYLVE
ncbi:TadE/TadG family type IV pilus assembly protein [Altererythrobacter sp. MF3-039]|uniref:TadE/TadG family type IV pilus assembly protein n=1 Tax=Altererythrobacter sp. MF3-039 TaxID=3252901 RepID=UPI00390CCE76